MRRFIYPAPVWEPSTDLATLGVQDVGTPGRPVYLLHRPAPPGGRTVVYCHGNGSDLSTIAPLATPFVAAGLGFAAVEYPGYGPAHGDRPTQGALLDTVRRGLAHLASVGPGPGEVVLVGESLGSSVAAHLAHEGRCCRLVLVSPFTSMVAMVRHVSRVRVLPARVVPDAYDTLALAPEITVATLLLHGSADSMVPPAMSQRLAAAIPDARRVVLAGRDHDTVWAPPSEALEEVRRFALA